jgi:hypothetical protein
MEEEEDNKDVKESGDGKRKQSATAQREAENQRRWTQADATNNSMRLRLLRTDIREVDIDEGYRLTAEGTQIHLQPSVRISI